MTKLLVEGGMEYELAAGRYRIGRGPECHIQVDHSSISKAHCEISVDPLAVIITDLGSTNGTFIDGQPISKAELMNGQVLHLGSVGITMQRDIYDVVVPTLESGSRDRVTALADGTPCCYNHDSLAAAMECGDCNKLFCSACVHGIGLVGGSRLFLCPVCRGHCTTFDWRGRKAAKSWIGGLVTSVKKMTVRLLSAPRAEAPRGRR